MLLAISEGARDDLHARRIEREMRAFRVEPMMDEGSAVRAAANYRALRSARITARKLADLIIGTFCIHHDYALLHADRDFDGMAAHLGLRAV